MVLATLRRYPGLYIESSGSEIVALLDATPAGQPLSPCAGTRPGLFETRPI